MSDETDLSSGLPRLCVVPNKVMATVSIPVADFPPLPDLVLTGEQYVGLCQLAADLEPSDARSAPRPVSDQLRWHEPPRSMADGMAAESDADVPVEAP